VHVAVTSMLSGVDPQLEKEDGVTVRVIMLGWFEVDFSVTGATGGLQVKESGELPEPICDEKLMNRGFTLHVTEGGMAPADAR